MIPCDLEVPAQGEAASEGDLKTNQVRDHPRAILLLNLSWGAAKEGREAGGHLKGVPMVSLGVIPRKAPRKRGVQEEEGPGVELCPS